MTQTKRRNYTPTTLPLLVKKSSAGKGLFAGDTIPARTCIIEYVGRVISKAEEYSSKSKYLFEISRNKTIDGKPSWNKAGYINHSCRPNAEVEIYKKRVFIFAKRKIQKGEEIVYDYAEEYFNEHLKGKCRCTKCVPAPHYQPLVRHKK